MAGMQVAAYIVLAVTLAPALIAAGNLNPLAVHLLITYYAMLSMITPPVAAGAFLAATIAGAPPMRTAFQAMRLGVVIYFVPLFFVFNPAMILQGSIGATLFYVLTCIIGITFISAGLEGYLVGVGRVKGLWRPWMMITGLAISFPDIMVTAAGVLLAAVATSIIFFNNRKASTSVI